MPDQLVELPAFDPGDAAVLADPYPVYDRLRPGRVARDPLGMSVFSYRDAEAAFHDPHLRPGIGVVAEQQGTGAAWGVPGRSLTDSDGAPHQRLRRAVSPWFSARRVGMLRDRTRALVDEILDDVLAEQRPLDAMTELADIIPARLFCWMIGAPDADAALVAELSKDLLLVFAADPRHGPTIAAARVRLADYVAEVAARARRQPGDDLTTMLQHGVANGSLDPGDDLCLLEELVSAAVDNTAATAALALKVLAEHPAVWRLLHDHPDLIAPAVEECGRLEPSIRTIVKVATAPTTVGGVDVDTGTFVTLRVPATHRDPDVFDEPATFRLGRATQPGQLSFGLGRHYCLGASLGRMEVTEIVGGLVRRAPAAELLPGAELDINGFGVVHHLPLRLVPEAVLR
ncbi:cytochrome P450 [Desertimonas flava]|jgi:cytochrome P450|uniref:cytochrome P450 n=1 Tax=Desertimonas flava TaxID=2064846 RepID=UPI000E34491E|nr:cytochrome P450 [Desertimonas flava]